MLLTAHFLLIIRREKELSRKKEGWRTVKTQTKKKQRGERNRGLQKRRKRPYIFRETECRGEEKRRQIKRVELSYFNHTRIQVEI